MTDVKNKVETSLTCNDCSNFHCYSRVEIPGCCWLKNKMVRRNNKSCEDFKLKWWDKDNDNL
jgi:predicted aldo/keto reductase-like oxidoreductase